MPKSYQILKIFCASAWRGPNKIARLTSQIPCAGLPQHWGQRWTDTAWRRLWLAQGALREDSYDTSAKQLDNQDELQQIKGIGPTFAKRLHQADIHTPTDLAKFTAEQVKEIISTNWRTLPINVQEWIEQAHRLDKED